MLRVIREDESTILVKNALIENAKKQTNRTDTGLTIHSIISMEGLLFQENIPCDFSISHRDNFSV